MSPKSNYDLKFTTQANPELVRNFTEGRQMPNMETSVAQFILLSLANITLRFVSYEEISAMLKNFSKFEKNTAYTPLEKGLVDTVIRKDRLDINYNVHQSPPYSMEEFRFITAIYPIKNIGGKSFSLGGVEGSVWVATTFCLLAMAILSIFFKRFVRESRDKKYLFFEYVWFYTSSILQNDSETFPKRLSAKFLLAGWLMGTSIIMKSYSGNLKSNMAVSKSVRINTVEDLKNIRGTMPITRARGIDLSAQVGINITRVKSWPTQDHLSFFKNGTIKFALLDNVVYVKYVLSQSIPLQEFLAKKEGKLFVGNRVYYSTLMNLDFSKRLPRRLLHNIDVLVVRFVETAQSERIFRYQNRFIHSLLASGNESPMNDASDMTVSELALVFSAWSYGIVLSCLTLCIEMLTCGLGRETKTQRRRKTHLKLYSTPSIHF